MGTVKSQNRHFINRQRLTRRGCQPPNGNCGRSHIVATLSRVNDEITRDPFNIAVAAVLNDAYERLNSPLTRLMRATGKSKNTVLRYLAGDRDIRVAELRNITAALGISIADVLNEAERRVK